MKINQNPNAIAFTGAKEKKALQEAIESYPVWRLLRTASNDVFKGITLEELNSKEIQEAATKRKSQEIFQGGKDAIDKVIEILKRPFEKKA